MGNILISIFAVALTFTAGSILAFRLSHLQPLPVSLCTLASNPTLYDGRHVTLTADAIALSDGWLMAEDANCAIPDAAATVLPVESATIPDLAPGTRVVLTLTGTFDAAATPGCFAPRFAIREAAIRRVDRE